MASMLLYTEGENEELVAFLQELRPHYKIALLSNATPHVRDVITHRFRLSHLFDAVVISAEEGVKKPEPESYERTLHRLQIPAQETVFVDDDQGYVTAAQAQGMCGIVFRTAEQVMRDLHELLEPNKKISSCKKSGQPCKTGKLKSPAEGIQGVEKTKEIWYSCMSSLSHIQMYVAFS